MFNYFLWVKNVNTNGGVLIILSILNIELISFQFGYTTTRNSRFFLFQTYTFRSEKKKKEIVISESEERTEH